MSIQTARVGASRNSRSQILSVRQRAPPARRAAPAPALDWTGLECRFRRGIASSAVPAALALALGEGKGHIEHAASASATASATSASTSTSQRRDRLRDADGGDGAGTARPLFLASRLLRPTGGGEAQSAQVSGHVVAQRAGEREEVRGDGGRSRRQGGQDAEGVERRRGSPHVHVWSLIRSTFS